jgi:chemotaxis protein methyltransferase CheR
VLELALRPGCASDEALAAFGRLARERFGLAQPARDDITLKRRLAAAMEAAGCAQRRPEAFVRQLAAAPDDSPLVLAAVDALTNQETCFFRDAEQLRAIVRGLVPALAGSAAHGEPLRILSAGCSTGEEAYSLTMLLLDELHVLWGRPVAVWGADLSASAIEHARAGQYRAAAIARAGEGPLGWESRFFRREGDRLVARDLLRERTCFMRANLLEPESLAPFGPFDLVLCRNVFIYFDADAIGRALRGLAALTRPHARIVLGNAESGAAVPPLGWARNDGIAPCLARLEVA